MSNQIGAATRDVEEMSALVDQMAAPLKALSELASVVAKQGRAILEGRSRAMPKADATLAGIEIAERALTLAKEEYARLKARHSELGPTNLIGDPAWVLLVDLYIRGRHQLKTPVSSASIASLATPTTALRYIRKLEEIGWIERSLDIHDARRVFLNLTPMAMDRMTNLLAADGRPELAPSHPAPR